MPGLTRKPRLIMQSYLSTFTQAFRTLTLPGCWSKIFLRGQHIRFAKTMPRNAKSLQARRFWRRLPQADLAPMPSIFNSPPIWPSSSPSSASWPDDPAGHLSWPKGRPWFVRFQKLADFFRHNPMEKCNFGMACKDLPQSQKAISLLWRGQDFLHGCDQHGAANLLCLPQIHGNPRLCGIQTRNLSIKGLSQP